MKKELIKTIEDFNKKRGTISTPELKKYEEAVAKLNGELSRVVTRKTQAAEKVAELKDKLGLTGIDVLTVEDEKKKLDFLGKRRRLKEQLEDEELYLEINVEAYRKQLYEAANLDQLKVAAHREQLANQKVYEQVIKELKNYIEDIEREQRSATGLGNAFGRTVKIQDAHKKKVDSYNALLEHREAKAK